MIFTMDIGNTNIKTGLFQGKELVRYWRLSTNRSSTSDEYGMLVTNLFRSAGLSPDQVTGIMLSSVVPPVNFTIEHMCNDYFGIAPKFVVPGVKTGINIQYDNPRAQRPHLQRGGRAGILWRAVHLHRFRHGHNLRRGG